MLIGLVGAGKLGMPVALAIESKGHEVMVCDPDPRIGEALARRHWPFREDGVPELMATTKIENVDLVRLVEHAEIIFVVVQTPHAPEFDGSTLLRGKAPKDFDYTHLVAAVQALAAEIRRQGKQPSTVISVVSTVLPGTMRREVLPITREIPFAYNPCFAAMGTVVQDFLRPEFTLIGVDGERSQLENGTPDGKLLRFYRELHQRPICLMSIESSELTKVAYNCFSGDTRVPMLNGTEESMRNLVGKGEQWFYGCYKGRIVPVRGRAVIAQPSQPLLEVELDNGEKVRCTHDHKWMLRDGSYREAQSLRPGDSLMPLYRRLSEKGEDKTLGQGYEMYLDLDGEWKPTHRMFSDLTSAVWRSGQLVPCEKSSFHRVRHHLDGNRRNNYPDNLVWMSWRNHNRMHREVMLSRSRKARERREREDSERAARKCRYCGGPFGGGAHAIDFCSRSCFTSFRNQNRTFGRRSGTCTIVNHRVVSIRPAGVEDTYCIMVDHPCHNFALSAGTFVHNTAISTKIVLANQIMEICDRIPGCDVDHVTNALELATDRIVSARYMRGGMGDGGSCHPRDCIAMSWLSQEYGLRYDLFGEMMRAREKQTKYLVDVIEELQEESGLLVVLLGKSYKPESAITAGSCALLLADILKRRGIDFIHADPYVDGYPTITGPAPALYVIATKHKNFQIWKFERGSVVIDPFRFMPDQEGVRVYRVGKW